MKKLVSLLILLAALGLLAATNPDKEDFVDWTKTRMTGGSDQPLARLGAAFAAPAVGAVTTVKDYGICSIFKTEAVKGTRYTLGILGGFVALK